MPQDSKIKNKDILLFDFGATYNGYRSDMTRTVFIGDASDEERKIYNIVLNAHIKSASMLKPAIKCSEVDKCARNIISDAGYKEFFLHYFHLVCYSLYFE